MRKKGYRTLSWFVSIFAHAVVLSLVLCWPLIAPGPETDLAVIDLDLVDLPPDQVPPPPGGEAAPLEEGLAAPPEEPEKVEYISPVKAEWAKRPILEKMATQSALNTFFGNGTIKQGNEVRKSLRSISLVDYAMGEYAGHYQIKGSDRYVTILELKGQKDKFLFYDSKTGLFRDLIKYERFVYTYGPAMNVHEPIMGSIIFVLQKFQEKYPASYKPSRIFWMPENGLAEVGEKIRLVETPAVVDKDGDPLKGTLFMLPDDKPKPGVVWLTRDGEAGLRRAWGFARVLALNGLAVLVMEPRKPGRDPSPLYSAADIKESVEFLRKVKGVDPSLVGAWAMGGDVAAALQAARSNGLDFMVNALAAEKGEDQIKTPDPELIRKVAVPNLWILSWSADKKSFTGLLGLLAPLAEAGGGVSLKTFESSQSFGDDQDLLWLKGLGPGYKKLAVPWIKGVKPAGS